MEYTITTATKKNVSLSGEAHAAIMFYAKIIKINKRLAKIEEGYQDLVNLIPDSDMEAFVEITDEIDKQAEK